MAVGGGFAQVLENTVTLLVTDAVVAEDVDAAQVKKQLADVVERLSHPASDEDYRDLLRLRRSLQARLSLVE
jgi:F0F1-type ATP synthase epsilon subunit